MLNDYAKNSVSSRELLQQDVLRKWTQPAINEFYRYCFNQHVTVDMNITIGYLKLFGSKEAVIEAENNYYREQIKQSEQARLAAIARNIIWAYKINDNTSEKYSPELNARIEDAYSSKVSSVSIGITTLFLQENDIFSLIILTINLKNIKLISKL